MKKMPYELKNKIRQLQKAIEKTNLLTGEIHNILENDYGLNIDLFYANGNVGVDEQTEALSSVIYAEGDVEENINSIEKIFLKQVNQVKE